MRQIVNRNRKRKFRLPFSALLLYLVLMAVTLFGVTFSKYITGTTPGDTARVAVMRNLAVTETGSVAEPDQWIVTPGVDLIKNAAAEIIRHIHVARVHELFPLAVAVNRAALTYSDAPDERASPSRVVFETVKICAGFVESRVNEPPFVNVVGALPVHCAVFVGFAVALYNEVDMRHTEASRQKHAKPHGRPRSRCSRY